MFTGDPNKYIAAQGPGNDTTPAFWQMIWQYGIKAEKINIEKLNIQGDRYIF